MSETPMVTFSSVDNPNTWNIEGESKCLVFASPSEARRAEELFAAMQRELAAERERAALAIEELRNISKADWREWDEDCRNPQSFVDWAKSRAMFTLAAIDMPHSTQEDAERYRWLREPQDHFGVLVEEMRGDRYTNTHFFAVREELDALIDAARRK